MIKAFRYAIFQVVTVITTTGYATTDFAKWPMFSKSILMMLTVVGACASSTGGGIKVSRLLVGIKCIKTLGNVGPGMAKVGPMGNFADFSILSKLVLCFDMLAGRLEIFPFLVLFTAPAWRRKF